MNAGLTPWVVLLIAVAALLAVDLGVLGRLVVAHPVPTPADAAPRRRVARGG